MSFCHHLIYLQLKIRQIVSFSVKKIHGIMLELLIKITHNPKIKWKKKKLGKNYYPVTELMI